MKDMFTPMKIGNLKIDNRIIKSAAGSYSLDSGINKQAMMFYENLAKGGCGMIWCEDLQLYDYSAGDVKKMVDAVHRHGVKFGIQTYGMWQFASSSKHVTSPCEMDMDDYRHKELTTDEVHAVQHTILDNVKFAKECGFDAIELNCSSDHMFNTFMSRFWNNSREDQYSAETIENRARVVTELIQMIKLACGNDFPVQILFNGVEENLYDLNDHSLCITPDEAREFAKLFEKAGADSLHIRTSAFGNHCAGFMPDIMYFGEIGNTGIGSVVDFDKNYFGMLDGKNDGVAAFLDVASYIKQIVKIPVGVVGNMDPRIAEEQINNAINEDKLDFIMVNRALLADPYLPKKLKENKKKDIRPCTKCISCFKAVADMWGIGYCRVNPTYIRGGTGEMPNGLDYQSLDIPKSVLVIGGGPAGMEAACVAAERGHKVSLYDNNAVLGGRMNMAAAVKGKHDRILEFRDYLIHRMKKAGVQVNKSVTVDEAVVKKIDPDVVIIATGGSVKEPAKVDSKGLKIQNGITLSINDLGSTVCVVGGNIIAYDYMIYLVQKGKNVILVSDRSKNEIGIEQSSWQRLVLNEWIRSKNVQIYSDSVLDVISEKKVCVKNFSGKKTMFECDCIVFAENLEKDDSLKTSLREYNPIVIGDCKSPFNILEAVKDGNIAGQSI